MESRSVGVQKNMKNQALAKFQTHLFSSFYLTHRPLQMIAGICDQQNDEQPGNAVGTCKILVGNQCGDPTSPVPLVTAVVGIVFSVNAVTNMHFIQIFTLKVAKKMPEKKKNLVEVRGEVAVATGSYD
jgi:hypothetical protein